MKKFSVGLILAMLICMLTATVSARSLSEEKARISEVHAQALDRFYSKSSDIASAINRSYGYATLSCSRVGLFGRGRGVAVNNHTGEHLYIKMDEIEFLGLGFGLFGCIEYDMLLTFENQDAWDQFIRAKNKTSLTTVAVASGNNKPSGSGSKSLTARNVKTYMMPKKGLELSIGWSGIKVYAPKKLNN